MRTIHSLECDKCITNTFTEMSQLCEHQKEVHGVENSSNISQCDECDKSYETRNGLAIHKSVVHGKTLVKIFGCQPCDIEVRNICFFSSRSLKMREKYNNFERTRGEKKIFHIQEIRKS